MTTDRQNARSALLLMPMAVVMALCGVIPMAFVAYYSLHDTFGGNSFIWVGFTWFEHILVTPEFQAALLRSLGFSLLVLAIEIPLGLYVALKMPARGLAASALIVLFTVPLLTPAIVVGYLWAAMTLPKAGLLYEALPLVGLNLDMNHPVVVWLVCAAMDAWHWTGLVVLLCYAGLRAIPDDYYRAARIDGAGA